MGRERVSADEEQKEPENPADSLAAFRALALEAAHAQRLAPLGGMGESRRKIPPAMIPGLRSERALTKFSRRSLLQASAGTRVSTARASLPVAKVAKTFVLDLPDEVLANFATPGVSRLIGCDPAMRQAGEQGRAELRLA